MRLSGILMFLFMLGVSGVLAVDASANQRERVPSDINDCWDDPRFNEIGGAMIGDCLLEKADEVEAETRLMVRDQAQGYCRAHERQAFIATQTRWQSYRDGWCDIVADSPGNTPAYVNAMACRLAFAQDRRWQLQSIDDYGWPNCPFIKLDKQASHVGDPAGLRMQTRATSLAWEANGADRIRVTREDSNGHHALGEVDVSACTFCDSQAQECDDGVFVLESNLAENPENYLLFACHIPNGGRLLELHRISETQAPDKVWRVERTEGFKWQLDIKNLQVIPAKGPTINWPVAPERP